MEALAGVVRESLTVTALLCFPVTAVGMVVAVLQAATQIQEQTLTLLPKMLVVAGLCAAFGGAALRLCAALFVDVLAALPAIVTGA